MNNMPWQNADEDDEDEDYEPSQEELDRYRESVFDIVYRKPVEDPDAWKDPDGYMRFM